MKGRVSSSQAKLRLSLWPSRAAATPKTMGSVTKACSRHLEVPKQLRCLALVLLASPVLATAAAADDDDKAYPGAMCQLEGALNITISGDPQGGVVLGISRDENGRAFNPTNQLQVWICPVVKDFSGDDDNPEDPEFARISVIGDVKCDLRSRDGAGRNAKNASPDATIPDGNVSHLQYGPEDQGLFLSQFHGYYYFRCNVAARQTGVDGLASGVVDYLVTEKGED